MRQGILWLPFLQSHPKVCVELAVDNSEELPLATSNRGHNWMLLWMCSGVVILRDALMALLMFMFSIFLLHLTVPPTYLPPLRNMKIASIFLSWMQLEDWPIRATIYYEHLAALMIIQWIWVGLDVAWAFICFAQQLNLSVEQGFPFVLTFRLHHQRIK